MPTCPTCKQVLEAGVRFCPHDGTPLTETSATNTVRTPTGNFEVRPRSREIELPVLVGGRYRLVEYRGGGGMAKVYRAIDETLEREVAVKLINPELRTEPEFDARFQREARIASQLADPHIVVVHDFGLDPEHGPFLVMEYLQGQSLRERLQREGPLPLKAGLQLSAQLVLALIHAHGKNIVHRDIKPDNIFLLNQSGVRLHVRVLDFGIARIFGSGLAKAEALTTVGAVLGTPRYMSPEQLAGQPVDARSDVYTAALVVHEAITGQLPYVSGKKLCELCPEATAALQDLLDHCLKQNPNERPPSAVEVYLRLQELGKASGILLLPPGAMDKLVAARQQQAAKASAGDATVAYAPSPTGARRRQRRSLLLAAAALPVLVLLAVVAKVFLFPPAPPAAESLLGYGIGAPQDEVLPGLKVFQGGTMNPWVAGPRAQLGHVLRPDDLGVPEEALESLEVRHTRDGKVCAVFYKDKLRALVVQEPHAGGTARSVQIGSHAGAVFDAYPETASEHKPVSDDDAKKAKPVEVRRYDALGIGFEMSDGKVRAITLYPPVKP
jgi:tRNA A-37 threonylcarbamoyl transferase component Bud32